MDAAQIIFMTAAGLGCVTGVGAVIGYIRSGSKRLGRAERDQIASQASQKAVAALDTALDRYSQELNEALGRVDTLEVDLIAAQEKIHQLEGRLIAAQGDRHRLEQELQNSIRARTRLEEELDRQYHRIVSLEKKLRDAGVTLVEGDRYPPRS